MPACNEAAGKQMNIGQASNGRADCAGRRAPFLHLQDHPTNRAGQRLRPLSLRRTNLWHFSIARSVFCRPSLWRWAPDSACGAPSTSWRATVTTTLGPMLMYGKEASNRKQEIDCQYHTIPNQRPKDKHYGNVHNRLFRHG